MKHASIRKTAGRWLTLLLAVLISIHPMMASASENRNVLGTGDACITIDIVTSVYDYVTSYDVYTDESNLLGALLGVGLIQGEAASWGFNVTTVNGRRADYENKGEYWRILRFEEDEGQLPLETGIGATPAQNGDRFVFVLENADVEWESAIVEGLTIDNLSTRSGPSTQYRETGTYKVKGEYVRILSLAYDGNDVCWLQCEVTYAKKLRRVYTGLKRFDTTTFDLNSVPEEIPLDDQVKVAATSKAMYGPGDGYGTYDSLTVDKGQTVFVIAIENDYAQVEWKTSKQSYRAWVPVQTLAW